ncbi:MAG: hypothetical protein MUC61_02610 [Amoebophilaceae bacterium]|nr:hypothetical protein [Amoebophilaceae bacterium]
MNSYFQHLAGEATPLWGQLCTASDLVHGKAIARQWGMQLCQCYRLVVRLYYAQPHARPPKRAQQARPALIGDSSNRRSSEKRPQMGRNYLKRSVGGRRNALLEGIRFNLMLLLREIAGYFFVLLFRVLVLLVLPRQEYLQQTS